MAHSSSRLKSKPKTTGSESKVKRTSASRSSANPVIILCKTNNQNECPFPHTHTKKFLIVCYRLKKNNIFCIPTFYFIIYIKNYNIFVYYHTDFIV